MKKIYKTWSNLILNLIRTEGIFNFHKYYKKNVDAILKLKITKKLNRKYHKHTNHMYTIYIHITGIHMSILIFIKLLTQIPKPVIAKKKMFIEKINSMCVLFIKKKKYTFSI